MPNFGYVVQIAASQRHHDFIGDSSGPWDVEAWMREQGYQEVEEGPSPVRAMRTFVKLNHRGKKEYAYVHEISKPHIG